MGKPTEEQLEQALAQAAVMREQGDDAHFLAKSLLNHHYRLKKMDVVITAMKHYLNFGESTMEHARLVKAIAELDRIDDADPDSAAFGLD